MYAGITVGFVVLVNIPLFSPFFPILPSDIGFPYARLLKTIVFVAIAGQALRMLVSVFYSLRAATEPPPIPADASLPTVSVVIPAYDEMAVLPDTLSAVTRLAYPSDKLEVVVCYEANSTDRTPAIATHAAAAFESVTALERDEPGGGKANAVNFALDHVSGDIVYLLDADHRPEPDVVRRAVRWFHADPDVWCVKGRCFGRNPTDSLLSLHATVERHLTERGEIFARDRVGGFAYFGGSNGFFRREVFESVGTFDPAVLVEDIDLSVRLYQAGKDIRVDPTIITTEEHPPSFRDWWAQRKRWARGWLQVSLKHFRETLQARRMTLRTQADTVYTLGFTVVSPLLVVAVPLPILDFAYFPFQFSDTPATYVPYDGVVWTLMVVLPVVAAIAVFCRDRVDGHTHGRSEYAAVASLGVYLFIQLAVYAAAFLDHFVFRKQALWVSTSRADDDGS